MAPTEHGQDLTAAARIPFSLHGCSGCVHVRVDPVEDGEQAGFDVLSGLPFDADAAVGFPAMSATVEYGRSGYRTMMGWIQTLRTTRTVLTAVGEPDVADCSQVDVAPAWADLGVPFLATGSNPSVFDAPAHNLNGADRLVWTADTVLTTLPLRSRTEPIRRLASFRWGYTETSTPGHAPTLLPLTVTAAAAWDSRVALLRRRFPDWVFESS